MRKELVKKSKFLSWVLRHKPEEVGLKLDPCGWANVEELLEAMRFDPEILREVVETNDKKRFSFNEDGTRIRANQGHSIMVDLGLEPVGPPPILYHGTAEKNIHNIMMRCEGLQKRGRQYVHLSEDQETAIKVGQRHGKVVVLTIRACHMVEHGFQFFLSENGVWLTDHVPSEYIDMSRLE